MATNEEDKSISGYGFLVVVGVFVIIFYLSANAFFKFVPELNGLTLSDVAVYTSEHWKNNLEYPELNPVLKRALNYSFLIAFGVAFLVYCALPDSKDKSKNSNE